VAVVAEQIPQKVLAVWAVVVMEVSLVRQRQLMALQIPAVVVAGQVARQAQVKLAATAVRVLLFLN
jgi:hypothetical protein